MTVRITTPGLHQISAEDYHRDCCAEPSLSSSVGRILIDECPRKAWYAHPRFYPQTETDPTRPKEIGTAAHKIILDRGRDVVAIDATDYKAGAARADRAKAYAEGHAPILKADLAKAEAMADAFKLQLAEIEDCAGFHQAPSEVVAIAQDETGATLRIMMDRFEDHGAHAVIWDIKTGDQSAAPQSIGRRIANMGNEFQAAFYERVILTLRPELAGRLKFRWCFIENDAPHLMTVGELDAAGMTIGRKKVAAAIHLWNRCIETGIWPGYPAQIVVAEYPPYAEAAWLNREMNDETMREMGIDPFFARSPWSPPRQSPQITEPC